MGSEYHTDKLAATNAADAVKEGHAMISQAAWEHGHGGYTGSYAECTGVELLQVRAVTSEAEAYALLDEHCEKWGPMLIVEVQGAEGSTFYAGGVLVLTQNEDHGTHAIPGRR